MRVMKAFLVRDFRVAWSYKFSFLTQLVGIVVSIFTLRLIGDVFEGSASTELAQYGGDFFAFALVGSTLSFIAYPAVKSFPGAIRGAQVNGTLEAMLTTRARPLMIVVGGGGYSIVVTFIQLSIVLGVGTFAFGAPIEFGGLALASLVLLMTFATLAGIGLMSAAFTLAFKQSEPFSGMLIGSSFLLSGTLYPTSVLPSWLSFASPLIPLTHSIALARELLLEGAAIDDLWVHWVALSVSCLALPVGIFVLHRALAYARRAGSLSQY